MKVRARETQAHDAPAEVAEFATPGQVFLDSGRLYTVYAMALFAHQLLLLVVDNLKYPAWIPAWFFEVDDASVPQEWVCTLSRDDPTMIQGPSFLAGSVDEYSRMVELEDGQVQRFWKYVADKEGS